MDARSVEHASSSGAMTVALALAAGMICHVLARHLRLPGIVLLLGAGYLLGPEVAGVIRPDSLGEVLHVLVGFAVAVILFEGGLNLDVKRLRREAHVLRWLLTVGSLITAAGATVAARFIMDWDWRLASLFGSLVIVTGPTVITPLLRRIKVTHRVETVLEAEGVLIDAIGAVVAVVALQVAILPEINNLWRVPIEVLERLSVGLAIGLVGGAVLALLLRSKRAIPEGLENVLTLSLVTALFQLSNRLQPESGIMAVTAAGILVGNLKIRIHRDLQEFKEQLTVMFIGLLFVLLAADVRQADIVAVGLPGLWTVLVLMLVVRPLNVWVCTFGTEMHWKERAFLAWLAPRGVVAAAVGSLFAQTLDARGIDGGAELRALVFVVIATTVVVQGLSGGVVASLLGVRRPREKGYVIIGANALARALAAELKDAGEEVVLVDSNPQACRAAEADGFRVVYGNALEERTLQRAQVDDRRALVALTPSDEVNLLVSREVRDEFKVPEIVVAVSRTAEQVRPKLIHEEDAHVLFGEPEDLELWSVRLRRSLVSVEKLTYSGEGAEGDRLRGIALPLTLRRGSRIRPFHDDLKPRKGDVVRFAVFVERRDEALAELARRGYAP